jgi:hypothetical protein
MYVDKVSVDEMSIDEMSADEMSVDEKHVDEMAVSLFFVLEEYCLIEQKQVVQFSLKDREKMTPRATTIKPF